LAVGAAWVAFTLPTTSWLGWNEAIRAKYAADVLGYQQIAEAAPGLPPQGALLPQHAQHFAPHYLAGLLAHSTGIPLHAVYRVLALAVLAAIAIAVDRLLTDARVSPGSYVACMGALLTSPYLFRFDALAPGMLQDSTFALGATLCLLGLVGVRPLLSAAGLAVAVASRGDSAIMLAAVAPAWIALTPRGRRQRRRALALALATTVATAAATVAISQKFAGSGDVHGVRSLTLIGTLASLPGSIGTLGSHVARLFVGITAPATLTACALLLAFVSRRRLSTETAWSLVLCAAIVGEAFALNPGWLQGSQPRLTSFAVAPLAAASGLALGEIEKSGAWSWTPRSLALVCVAIAVASLQHHYASLRPASSAGEFLALELVCAAAMLTPFVHRAIALRARRRDASGTHVGALEP
jgi:hypothetical protein